MVISSVVLEVVARVVPVVTGSVVVLGSPVVAHRALDRAIDQPPQKPQLSSFWTERVTS